MRRSLRGITVGVSAVFALLTAPQTADELPENLRKWRELLGDVGGEHLQTGALLVAVVVFVGAILGPWLWRALPLASHPPEITVSQPPIPFSTISYGIPPAVARKVVVLLGFYNQRGKGRSASVLASIRLPGLETAERVAHGRWMAGLLSPLEMMEHAPTDETERRARRRTMFEPGEEQHWLAVVHKNLDEEHAYLVMDETARLTGIPVPVGSHKLDVQLQGNGLRRNPTFRYTLINKGVGQPVWLKHRRWWG